MRLRATWRHKGIRSGLDWTMAFGFAFGYGMAGSGIELETGGLRQFTLKLEYSTIPPSDRAA